MRHLLTFILSVVSITVNAQEFNVSGRVTDISSGNPIQNATIKVLNSQKGAITNGEGVYELPELPQGYYVVSVSYIGYATQQKEITVKAGTISVNFVLVPQTQALDEVTVTSAAKREIPIIKVPVSITRVTGERLDDMRIWDQRSMSQLTGNINVSNPGEGDAIGYSIRGILAADFNPSVVTYIDGINQFDIYSNIEFLHDVESIEILKGPQGTLFGRNAMGGAINITTKEPTNIWRGKAEAALGNFAVQRYNVLASGPIVKDKLFFKVSGLFGKQDGFYSNTVDNSNFNSKEYTGINTSLKYQISGSWSASLYGKRYTRDVVGYVPYAADISTVFSNPYETSQNAVGNTEHRMNQGAIKIEHTGKELNISNVLGYQNSELVYNNVDIDFSPLDFNTFSRPIPGAENTVKVLTNELNLSSPAGAEKLNWVGGSYIFRQHIPINQIIRTGEDAVMFDPNAPNQVFNFNDGINTGVAFFGQLTYPLSKTLKLTAGIRYDYEEREITTQTDFIQGNNPQVTVVPSQTRKANFDAFSPKLGLQWSVSPKTNLYALYSKGYRIGGINGSIDPRFESYDPETSDNFELGIKGGLLDNTFNYAVSAFFINRNAIQTQVFEPVNTGISFVTLSNGDGRNLGLEIEFGYLVAKGLQISYNLGLLDAKYTSLEIPDFTAGGNLALADKTVILAPSITSHLALDYSKPIVIGKNELDLGGTVQLTTTGRQYFDFNNDTFQRSYSLVNLRFGGVYNGVGLHFWAQNLLDEQFIQWAPPIGAPTPFLGAPLTYGTSLSYKF